MPDTLRILGHEFTVQYEQPGGWGDGKMGYSTISEGIIGINADMHPDAQDSTVLHEIVHIVADLNGLDMNEQCVATLSTGLFQALRDNPEFFIELIAPVTAPADGNALRLQDLISANEVAS